MFRGLLIALACAGSPAVPAKDPAPAVSVPMDAPTPSGVHRGPGADEAAHVLGGFWAAGAGYAAATHVDLDSRDRPLVAVATAAAASLAKEAFDAWVQDERFSGADLLADALGAFAFLALVAVAGP
ncbi:MAG: hypothetical protein KY397_02915 [Gemmatimonadetes bacterium]|nr:hypothetical protein [Gemmatimonadota bacterium]